jgi:hypothetical protein
MDEFSDAAGDNRPNGVAMGVSIGLHSALGSSKLSLLVDGGENGNFALLLSA